MHRFARLVIAVLLVLAPTGCGGGATGPAATVAIEGIRFNDLALDADQVLGRTGRLVSFDLDYTGPVRSILWDFGGGAIPNAPITSRPQIRLEAPGTYAGSVVIAGPEHVPVVAEFSYRVEVDAPTIREVTPNWYRGLEGETVTFKAVLNDPVVNHEWNFGGGGFPGTSLEPEPSLKLWGPGRFNGVLNVHRLDGFEERFEFVFESRAAEWPETLTSQANDASTLRAFGGTRAVMFTPTDPPRLESFTLDATGQQLVRTAATTFGPYMPDLAMRHADVLVHNGKVAVLFCGTRGLTNSQRGMWLATSDEASLNGAGAWPIHFVSYPEAIQEVRLLGLPGGGVMALAYCQGGPTRASFAWDGMPDGPPDWVDVQLPETFSGLSNSALIDGNLVIPEFTATGATINAAPLAEVGQASAWTHFELVMPLDEEQGWPFGAAGCATQDAIALLLNFATAPAKVFLSPATNPGVAAGWRHVEFGFPNHRYSDSLSVMLTPTRILAVSPGPTEPESKYSPPMTVWSIPRSMDAVDSFGTIRLASWTPPYAFPFDEVTVVGYSESDGQIDSGRFIRWLVAPPEIWPGE